jgi:hypothetical protein
MGSERRPSPDRTATREMRRFQTFLPSPRNGEVRPTPDLRREESNIRDVPKHPIVRRKVNMLSRCTRGDDPVAAAATIIKTSASASISVCAPEPFARTRKGSCGGLGCRPEPSSKAL